MFDSKLAHSIQQDHRLSAETHRFKKARGSVKRQPAPILTIALVGGMLATLLLLI